MCDIKHAGHALSSGIVGFVWHVTPGLYSCLLRSACQEPWNQGVILIDDQEAVLLEIDLLLSVGLSVLEKEMH